MQDMPYFMENKEWYGFDYKKRRYYCTDQAPQEAKDSLDEFYEEENRLIHNSKQIRVDNKSHTNVGT